MKIGITIPTMIPNTGGDVLMEWARRADAGPFSSVAVGERITYPNFDMTVTLAAAAAVTRRVRLVSTVTVLPLHSAALVAKQAASIDALSGGRLTLGVGIGGREEDCLAVGTSVERRHQRMEEQVATMRRIWRGEPPFPGAQPIGPRPVQDGGPEILVGAIFPGAIQRVMRWADGLSAWSFEPNVEVIRQTYQIAEDAWRAAGRRGRPRFVMGCYYALGPRADEYLDAALMHYHAYFGADIAAEIVKSVSTKTPQSIRDALRALADIGTDEMILVPVASDIDQLERLADLIG